MLLKGLAHAYIPAAALGYYYYFIDGIYYSAIIRYGFMSETGPMELVYPTANRFLLEHLHEYACVALHYYFYSF